MSQEARRTTMRRREVLLTTAALMGASALPAAAATPKSALVIADAIDDLISMDPAESFEFSGQDLLNNTYQQLFEFDPANINAGFKPGVIEKYEIADDGKSYTFEVRKGLKFHSGNPVTASDVVFSLTRAVKLALTPSFILSQFGPSPDNADEMIQKTGDYTLTMKVDQPYAPSFILNCLTAEIASVIDEKLAMEHAVQGDFGHAWVKTHDAGSGPYRLVSWKPNESYVLEAVPGSGIWPAKLKRIIVRHIPEAATQQLLLEKGDVDIARKLLPSNIQAVEKNPLIKVEADLKGRIYYFSLNQKNEILSNPKVIEAMKWLVDYEGMASSILKGQFVVHQTFEPKTFLGVLDKNPYKLDVAKGKQLLAEAGYPDGFKITMDARNVAPDVDMATAIQGTFAQGGIKLEVLPGDGKQTLTKYRARNHDIYVGAWGPDYPDPNTNASTFTSNPDNRDEAKLTGKLAWRNAWDIPELTKETAAATLERDQDKRVKMYEGLQQTMLDRGPFVIMFQEIVQSAMRKDVEGFHTGGPVTDVSYWTVTK
jgi:peptide/nickel transport system substrate-binding protein